MYQLIGPHNHITLTATDINLLLLVIVWEIVWKGIALWKAGRNNQPVWFICLLVINTLGILEIVYLLYFQAKQTVSDKARDEA